MSQHHFTPPRTNGPNADAIEELEKYLVTAQTYTPNLKSLIVELELARDLLVMHDSEAISLDDWGAARLFVENFVGTIHLNRV